MDWDKLRIFHVVAQAGSFTHAGESLKLSQSAVSRHISALEETLGVTLFHRHARGLILTEQGELLHKTSQDIFSKLALIEGQMLDSKDLPEGLLTITAAEFIGTHWLSPRLQKFKEQNPGIQIEIILEDRVLNLGMREADAAIRLYKPEQGDLIQRQIASVNLVVCASQKYLEKNGTPQRLEDLKSHTLLAYPDNFLAPYNNPNWLLTHAGIETSSRNVIRINSISALASAVESGLGIAVLPRFIAKRKPGVVEIMSSVKRDTIDMYFVYPQERRHSKRIALFRDFILKEIENAEF